MGSPRSLWMQCLMLVACGSAPPAPTAELRAGMDPHEAADRAIASFEDDGFVLDVREDGPDFVAFGAAHPDGRTVVRIATARGWVLAVTAPSAEHSRPWVRLGAGTPDVDGNGLAELLVTAPDAARGVTCASVVEIREGGAVERRVDFSLYGGEGCVVGRAEDDLAFRAHVFYPDLSRGVVPRLELMLGRGLRVSGAEGLSDAGDPAAHWAKAVEAAARSFVLGEDAASQRRAFEALADCRQMPEACALLRSRIADGWQDQPEEAGEVPTDE